eukprot:309500_1
MLDSIVYAQSVRRSGNNYNTEYVIGVDGVHVSDIDAVPMDGLDVGQYNGNQKGSKRILDHALDTMVISLHQRSHRAYIRHAHSHTFIAPTRVYLGFFHCYVYWTRSKQRDAAEYKFKSKHINTIRISSCCWRLATHTSHTHKTHR